MVKYETEELAFPAVIDQDGTKLTVIGGLTKREYFIAMAMQGLCAREKMNWGERISAEAIKIADETLTLI